MIKKIINYLKNLMAKRKDPTRTLEKQYSKLLLEARNLQRGGDIPAFAAKTREAEDIRKKIEELTE
jgi:hypothetical protein